MAAAPTVGVEGLADLRRVLRKMEGALDKDLRSHLLDAAEIVAKEARSRAATGTRPIPVTRRPRKRMKDTIRPFARGAVGGIRSTATNAGYPYPKRQEYDGSQGKPFMRPALDAKAPEVERRMAQMLDDLADTWGRGTT
jgi:hypothetical protein